jgi:hypothetical protein
MKVRSKMLSRRFAPLLLGLVLLALLAPTARADFGIQSFSGQIIGSPAEEPFLQAAGHPYEVAMTAQLNSHSQPPFGFEAPDGSIKRFNLELPVGLTGNPRAVTRCRVEQLAASEVGCPIDSQVGTVAINVGTGAATFFSLPLYNMVPRPGVVATFGFNSVGTPVLTDASVRSGDDYGISATVPLASQAVPVIRVQVNLWGVPGDPRHDESRGICERDGGSCPTDQSLEPFLTLPSSCPGTPLDFGLETNSWQEPANTQAASFSEDPFGTPFVIEGCEGVPFSPSVQVRPDTSAAASPTGLAVDLTAPQVESFDGIASADLKDVRVQLPPGMTVNASSADGLSGCSPAQIALKSPAPPSCPDSSKLGSVSLQTPLLEAPLPGSVYLATQGTNPFNSLLALYIAVDDPATGVVIKLAGQISPDSATGQLTATFLDNPQLPFEALHLPLKGGNRAALVTPPGCGTYTTNATLTGWADPGESIPSQSSFTIDENCAAASQFTPALSAGTANPLAGAPSPFTLRVTRPDGQQNISAIQATLPKGLLAKLKGVPYCPEANAATGDCPASSQVGTTTVGAGAGSNPIYVPEPGKAPTAVYLAGPYKNAPLSLVVKVPAQAGPFDLGTVAVRNALNVDPSSTQVTAVSDPLPQILQGIPISYRDVRVEMNRPDFTLNPTSCNAMAVTSTITSIAGATANPSSRFQVGSCERLAFAPKLSLSLKGATKRTGNPALKAVLTFPPKGGKANIKKTSVLLPKSIFIDNANINNPCTRVQFNANACPAKSILGKARAFTPLLDKPLEGPVYFRSNGGERELPDLVADLNGQIHVTLVGFIDAVKIKGTEGARVRTRFQNVPDAPVSKFVIDLKGGNKKGLLEISSGFCNGKQRAGVKFDGQNGKFFDTEPVVGTSCGAKGKSSRHRNR